MSQKHHSQQPKGKQLKCPLVAEWIRDKKVLDNLQWHISPLGQRVSEILIPGVTQMNLADLSCADQNKAAKEDKCCVTLDILCTRIVKFGETESTVVVAQGREGGGIEVI